MKSRKNSKFAIILSSILLIVLFVSCNTEGLEYVPLDDGTLAVSIGNAKKSGKIKIPEQQSEQQVSTIADYAFTGCTGIKSIRIPNSVTSIGYSAFSGCTGLKSVTLPNNLTQLGDNAFLQCSGLTSIKIPESVTSIGNSTFYRCTSLTGITIPDSVTSIGDMAFLQCTVLASITIPESVTNIGEGAFCGCTGLTTITFKGTKEQWNAITKGEIWDADTGTYTVHCIDGDIMVG